MQDEELIAHIDRLIAEEHALHSHSSAGRAISAADHARLSELEVQLDQLWDLLRRRRALRNAGADPDATGVRDATVVEGYQQ